MQKVEKQMAENTCREILPRRMIKPPMSQVPGKQASWGSIVIAIDLPSLVVGFFR
jgi:hypothetical protein